MSCPNHKQFLSFYHLEDSPTTIVEQFKKFTHYLPQENFILTLKCNLNFNLNGIKSDIS